jgi:integrase/recombinase XerD
VDLSDPQGFGRRLADFCEWMQVRNYSALTIKQHRSVLDLFITWANERGITRPNEVTKPVAERYQRHLYYWRKKNGEPLSFGSQYKRLSSLRTFFRWMCRQNLLLYNPVSELDLPKLEKRLPAVLTLQEVELLLSQPDVTKAIGVRDRAIMEVLYSTGMRRMEAVRLTLYSIDATGGTATIRGGKGAKDRVVPIGERAVSWVDRYVLDVRPHLVVEPDERWLFLTHDGFKMSPEYLSTTVRAYIEAAEILKPGSCHLFRHTMATLMLENGADVRIIQAMLGHSNLQTTEIYTHVSIRHLKQIHEATHPARPGRSTPFSEDADAVPELEEVDVPPS